MSNAKECKHPFASLDPRHFLMARCPSCGAVGRMNCFASKDNAADCTWFNAPKRIKSKRGR